MRLTKARIRKLNDLCRVLRTDVIDLLHELQTGHPGGSLSVTEILTALYFVHANISPQNGDDAGRDRIVLTKGHAAPMLYRILAEKGFFPKEELKTLRHINSRLQGHPCTHEKGMGIELSTGPLGIGLSAAVGMALSNKVNGSDAYVFAVTGDGELNEGVVWEALMSASKFRLDNLVIIVDHNGVQLDGTAEEIMPMGSLNDKFAAFGCNVIECDGHDIGALCDAIDAAKVNRGKPSVILAKTVKGKGVSFMENKNTWHGAPIDDGSYEAAMQELRGEADGKIN